MFWFAVILLLLCWISLSVKSKMIWCLKLCLVRKSCETHRKLIVSCFISEAEYSCLHNIISNIFSQRGTIRALSRWGLWRSSQTWYQPAAQLLETLDLLRQRQPVQWGRYTDKYSGVLETRACIIMFWLHTHWLLLTVLSWTDGRKVWAGGEVKEERRQRQNDFKVSKAAVKVLCL